MTLSDLRLGLGVQQLVQAELVHAVEVTNTNNDSSVTTVQQRKHIFKSMGDFDFVSIHGDERPASLVTNGRVYPSAYFLVPTPTFPPTLVEPIRC